MDIRLWRVDGSVVDREAQIVQDDGYGVCAEWPATQLDRGEECVAAWQLFADDGRTSSERTDETQIPWVITAWEVEPDRWTFRLPVTLYEVDA